MNGVGQLGLIIAVQSLVKTSHGALVVNECHVGAVRHDRLPPLKLFSMFVLNRLIESILIRS